MMRRWVLFLEALFLLGGRATPMLVGMEPSSVAVMTWSGFSMAS